MDLEGMFNSALPSLQTVFNWDNVDTMSQSLGNLTETVFKWDNVDAISHSLTSWTAQTLKNPGIVQEKALATFQSWKQFDFQSGVTPLSTWEVPVGTVVVYVMLIKFLQIYVRWRGKPFDLKKGVCLYNGLLSVGSLCLWLGLTTELFLLTDEYGFHNVLFDSEEILTRGRHYMYYYVNYIFKYVELIDTVLLALQAKPIIFLHEYHHAATLVLCWVQLNAHTCMQWVVIDMNLFVHIAMYSYYALSSITKNIWWKRYLTTLQILQFVVSVVMCNVVFGLRILGDLGVTWAPTVNSGSSAGSYFSAVFGIVVLVSYLILFLDLYREKYPEQTSKTKLAGGDSKTAPTTTGKKMSSATSHGKNVKFD